MRTIKFRGKKLSDNSWVIGHYSVFDGEGDEFHYIGNNIGWIVRVIPETVGQFTGLCDKNGKEIFEGDIGIRCLDFQKRYTDGKTWRDYWSVEWDNQSSGFVTTMFADYDTRFDKVINVTRKPNPYSKRFNEIEVIGNIHDNTDLLK